MASIQQPVSFASCAASQIALPSISGLEFQPIHAHPVYSASETLVQGLYLGHGARQISDLSYCNVSLAYSHTGHADVINVQVWLPHPDAWNGKLIGIGGGGFSAGLMDLSFYSMLGSVDDGYAAVSTDAGHPGPDPDPASWALDDDGQVNIYRLENFAHRAYDDQAKIGKAVAKNFYGSAPKRSYWNGCSTGGRQGLALAQRYPDAYNGILANAPALDWTSLVVSDSWAQFIMNSLKSYPRGCELDALAAAAVEECDLNDGVKDNIIADPGSCNFDPFTMVGREIDCDTSSTKITRAAAAIAQGAWEGPKSTRNSSLWYGFSQDASLTGQGGVGKSTCPPLDEGPCTAGTAFAVSTQWMQWFLARDADFDLTKLTHLEWEEMFKQSIRDYGNLMDTNNPDLSKYRNNGGKMITVHGTADQLIPLQNTNHYYDRVLKADPDAAAFYRYYEAPGMGHCFGGKGGFPEHVFEDLVAWVEDDEAPDTLTAYARPEMQGQSYERPLCQYPLIARYDGTGDFDVPQNYHCAEGYLSSTPISTVIERTKKVLQDAMKTKKPVRHEL